MSVLSNFKLVFNCTECFASGLIVFRRDVLLYSALRVSRNYCTAADSESDDIESMRNISRLPTELRNRMAHVMDPSTRKQYRDIVRHYRKLPVEREDFAKYGFQSGVDPRILWPSKEELTQTIAIENQFEPTLQDMWKRISEKKKEEEVARRKKQELISKQLAKMPQFIEQFRQKMQKKELARQEQEKKKEALVEEAREYYGYPISYYDPRIEELKAKKEEEEKKRLKAKKKEEKQARWLASLRGDKEVKQSLTNNPSSEPSDTKSASAADATKVDDNKTTASKKSVNKAKKAIKESDNKEASKHAELPSADNTNTSKQ